MDLLATKALAELCGLKLEMLFFISDLKATSLHQCHGCYLCGEDMHFVAGMLKIWHTDPSDPPGLIQLSTSQSFSKTPCPISPC